MLFGLEIKCLGQLLKNRQKQDEMEMGGWLTSKEVNTCHAASVELRYCYNTETNWCPLTFFFSL